MNNQSFAELFNQSLALQQIRPGAVIKGKVVFASPEIVIVNAGLKSDAVIPGEEFRNLKGEIEVKVGDEIDVVVETLEDGYGQTRLSREKAKRAQAWIELERAHTENRTVIGVITERVKGGFTVELGSVRAFLPGSLVDVKPVRDPSYLENKELEFKLIKIDRKRNNIVVSRRAVVEQESHAERDALLDKLQEGQTLVGVVKNITDYGAFVDLGGIDGLLHITDMAWKRVKHPSEILHIGDEVKVVVLKFDREKRRVSLGIKQLIGDPWADLARRYPVGARIFGKVTNITDYGCFVEIEDGIEGLVHMSEMDWTNKNIHPAKIVQAGQEVEVMVLEIDEDRRRISLGIKQCRANPWKTFAENHDKAQKVKGTIRSITDFGIFIGLDGGIDGLVHLSDISWTEAGEAAIHKYNKGQEVEAVILGIDSDRERISLGIKQLNQEESTANLAKQYAKDAVMRGKVSSIEAQQAILVLPHGVEGQLNAADFMGEEGKSLADQLKIDDEVEVKIVDFDIEKRFAYVTTRGIAKRKAAAKSGSDAAPSNTLGDILKESMKGE